MIGRNAAGKYDHGRTRPATVVHIGQPVGNSACNVQKCQRWFVGHSPVPVRHSGDHVFLKAQNTVQVSLTKLLDNLHFRRTRATKDGVDSPVYQCFEKGLCAIHLKNPFFVHHRS